MVTVPKAPEGKVLVTTVPVNDGAFLTFTLADEVCTLLPDEYVVELATEAGVVALTELLLADSVVELYEDTW